MKKIISVLLISYIILSPHALLRAEDKALPDSSIQTINHNIEAKIYKFKKKKHYTAVEIGFTNMSNKYVSFTPKEIYLDDKEKYSLPLLTMNEIRTIEQKKPGLALFPTALAVGLGIAALGVSRANNDAAFGLAMGALSAGGLALLTKGLENRAKQNKLIGFENNTISDIKRLPPGMTLGGILYFPPTKKPKSITVVNKVGPGKYEKKVFYLNDVKK